MAIDPAHDTFPVVIAAPSGAQPDTALMESGG
jgi:hypothetical protein